MVRASLQCITVEQFSSASFAYEAKSVSKQNSQRIGWDLYGQAWLDRKADAAPKHATELGQALNIRHRRNTGSWQLTPSR
mmetsp:Transcript_8427/g.13714  ORF Transcript_8427/g.13714 Transcript_8427/m.13714 type:complete len:80 (-) Transcript_8427:58-297(-)